VQRTSPISSNRSRAYATSTEFRIVFTENMAGMNLFSFLLTADLGPADDYSECNSHVGTSHEPPGHRRRHE
jgi:hypothetical protein